jgi:hypothetical protein
MQYPSSKHDLSRFSWHTGRQPRPVDPDEPIPVLFRDVGPLATERFFRNGLKRMAGPATPITYLRSAAYNEPYIDYAAIGRLVLLRPQEIQPWHSGVSSIYITLANMMPPADSLGFVPGNVPLAAAATRLAGVKYNWELRDAFGKRDYDESRREALSRLETLNRETAEIEKIATPLRIAFQTGEANARDRVREYLASYEIDEIDLCTAWHHLPSERRTYLKWALPQLIERTEA